MLDTEPQFSPKYTPEDFTLRDIFQNELTKTQMNLIIYAISVLDEEEKTSVFRLREVQEKFLNMSHYGFVKTNAEELETHFSKNYDGEHIGDFPIIFKDFSLHRGVIHIQWVDEYMNVLEKIRDVLIVPHEDYITKFESKYTILLFEYLLLKQDEEVMLKVDELIEIFNLQGNTGYENTFNFRKFVMNAVFEDLQKHEKIQFRIKVSENTVYTIRMENRATENKDLVITSEEFSRIIEQSLGNDERYEETLEEVLWKRSTLLSYLVDIKLNTYASEKAKALAKDTQEYLREKTPRINQADVMELDELNRYMDSRLEQLKPYTQIS